MHCLCNCTLWRTSSTGPSGWTVVVRPWLGHHTMPRMMPSTGRDISKQPMSPLTMLSSACQHPACATALCGGRPQLRGWTVVVRPWLGRHAQDDAVHGTSSKQLMSPVTTLSSACQNPAPFPCSHVPHCLAHISRTTDPIDYIQRVN